jgi:hypothetical protein
MANHSTTPVHRFAERLYPLGYPVSVETDDAQVAGLAKALWGSWQQMVTGDPLRISICCGNSPELNGRARFRATPAGFRFDGPESATFDSSSLRLDFRVRNQLSEHFLNTTILSALDFSLYTPIHGACVVRNGFGIVLGGDSGAGKSTLSYACARRGWALVCDDSLHLLPGLSATAGSLSSTIHLRGPARSLFAELEQEHMGIAPNGKPAMTILPGQRGFHTAQTARVDRLLFLARRAGPPRLTLLDPNYAKQQLVKCLWQPNLLTHQQRLLEVAQHAEAALFEYEQIEEAVDALDDLLKEEGMAA